MFLFTCFCFCACWKGVGKGRGIFKWSPCANVFKLKRAAVIWWIILRVVFKSGQQGQTCSRTSLKAPHEKMMGHRFTALCKMWHLSANEEIICSLQSHTTTYLSKQRSCQHDLTFWVSDFFYLRLTNFRVNYFFNLFKNALKTQPVLWWVCLKFLNIIFSPVDVMLCDSPKIHIFE